MLGNIFETMEFLSSPWEAEKKSSFTQTFRFSKPQVLFKALRTQPIRSQFKQQFFCSFSHLSVKHDYLAEQEKSALNLLLRAINTAVCSNRLVPCGPNRSFAGWMEPRRRTQWMWMSRSGEYEPHGRCRHSASSGREHRLAKTGTSQHSHTRPHTQTHTQLIWLRRRREVGKGGHNR